MSSDSKETEVTRSLRVDRLRAARERRGLTQHELARLCGFGLNQIARYENELAEPLSSAVAKLAQVLDVSTDYLLGLSDFPKTPATEDLLQEERRLVEAYQSGDLGVMIELAYTRWRSLQESESGN